MDYRDLVFISVAENLSFSKAAKELFISQPAVTKHIKELENKLDVNLFDRKTNKIVLTKSGKLVYNHLIDIKGIYSDLELALGSENNKYKGELRIGASSTISQYYLPPIIADFHKKFPLINFELYNGNSRDIEHKLEHNEIDIALVENESSQGNFKYFDLIDDELIVVCSNNSLYSKRKDISINDFLDTPIVLREKGSGTLEVINSKLSKLKIKQSDLNILVHLGSTESIKNFLPHFDGYAILSSISIEKELSIKKLVKINVNKLLFKRKFRIAMRFGKENMSSKLFLTHININNL